MTSNDGYNDAYNTPGWTSQNMAYPPPSSTTIDLPNDIPLVTISGRFRDGNGGLANGWFDIDNGNTILRHPSTKEIITPIKFRVEIKDGVFSVTVPATDSLAIASDASATWGYHVRVSLAGRTFGESFDVALPSLTPAVSVFDLPITEYSTGIMTATYDGGSVTLTGTTIYDGGTP